MRLRDFQFVRLFSEATDLDIDLDLQVDIIDDNQKDLVEKRSSVKIHSPTSISRTLFNLCYTLSEEKIDNPYKKDILSLALVQQVHDYLYRDGDDSDLPPILMSGNKNPLVNVLVKEIVEPITDKKIDFASVLMSDCNFTDPCRIVRSDKDLYHQFSRAIPFTEYPLIFVNSNIHNSAAVTSSLLISQLELFFEDATEKLVKNLLLGEELLTKIIKIVHLFEQNAEFAEDFLANLKSYCRLNVEEISCFVKLMNAHSGLFKSSQMYNKDVQVQWTNWPMMMGIIEKQLGGSRGGKQELTENMKEIDQEKEQLKMQRRSKKKRPLNFEDLLDIYREYYDTKAIEPGVLGEKLLQDVRVW